MKKTPAIRTAKDAASGTLTPQSRIEKIDKPKHTLVITGIPRSGTSLICSLLNELPEVVAFNEIFYDVHNLPRTLNEMRQRLMSGAPVPNKYGSNGKLASDTMDMTKILHKRQDPTSQDVIIATNVNVPYLLQARVIASFGCPIVAMVRDPLYTVASFCSRRASRIPEAQVGPAPLPTHPRWQAFDFKGRTPTERRAEVWNYIAGMICGNKIPFFHYENLIEDTAGTIREILNMTAYPQMRVPQFLLNSGNITHDEMDHIRDAVDRFAPNRKLLGYT